jgi:hypothetical protein
MKKIDDNRLEGASRYYSKPTKDTLVEVVLVKLEMKWGLQNIVVMIPFAITVEGFAKVMEVMKEYGF